MEKTMLVNVLADLVGKETEKRKRLKKYEGEVHQV